MAFLGFARVFRVIKRRSAWRDTAPGSASDLSAWRDDREGQKKGEKPFMCNMRDTEGSERRAGGEGRQTMQSASLLGWGLSEPQCDRNLTLEFHCFFPFHSIYSHWYAWIAQQTLSLPDVLLTKQWTFLCPPTGYWIVGWYTFCYSNVKSSHAT